MDWHFFTETDVVLDFQWMIDFYGMLYFGEILQQGVNFWVGVQADGLALIRIQSLSSIAITDDELVWMFWVYPE